MGGEAIAVEGDVSKAADVARLFKEIDSAFGRLDVLVNNAGVFRFGAFAEITEDSFHFHYNINVLGTILTVQEAIKRFGPDGGSIINLSSIVGISLDHRGGHSGRRRPSCGHLSAIG